ncbi:hypothetical protein SDC9_159471 [bioreactor metagenome]|uniref:Uncharacterized protein n=1 Tax=bioreactor metagenome TaxID=1076179 RepID=A0A645FFN4_9ZZZZ
MNLFNEHPGEHRGGSRRVCRHKGAYRKLIRCARAPGVEAEPPEPKQGGAQQNKRHVMGMIGQPAVIFTFSKRESEDQRADAGADMYDIASREIDRSDLLKEAPSPDHMSERVIYDNRPDADEQEQRGKAHSFDNRAGNQRGCDDSKHHLEDGKAEIGDGRRIRSRRRIDPGKAKPFQITDNAPDIPAEGERKAYQNP